MNKEQINIAFDWGGCITREGDLYEKIAENDSYSGPQSWDELIKKHFTQIESYSLYPKNFFAETETYPLAIETVNKYLSRNSSSPTKTSVVFDGRPILKNENKINFYLAQEARRIGLETNGFYVFHDKLKNYKNIGIDICVDDDPRICVSMAYAGIKSILLIRKWNRMFSKGQMNILVPENKLNYIKWNLNIAEDWYEADRTISKLIEKETERRKKSGKEKQIIVDT